jgi:tetratricopeptide (TPR) repeat protein
MKLLMILLLGCAAVVIGAMLNLNRQKPSPAIKPEPIAEMAPTQPQVDKPTIKAVVARETQLPAQAAATNPAQPAAAPPVSNSAQIDISTNSTPFRQAIDTLTSPQSTFQQRQAAWKQLRSAGELDSAIAALKQGVANNPSSAEYATSLGEAYVYKLQTLRDFHEVSILALQADQSFNIALSVDPSNWEAQFYKAAALSRWPAEMNKGPEVIQQLSHLIDQQEAMQSQPQFAQSYVLLGDQYKKVDQPDYALQTWKLGLAKFPGDSTLQARVSRP